MSLIASPLASLPPAPHLMPGVASYAPPRSTAASAQPSQDSRNAGAGNQAETRRQGISDDGRGSAQEQRMLAELKARDREVRSHENAHRAAGGDLVRGGSYDYQQGPDGKRYAVGGEVQIDTSPVAGDPDATAEKMRRVIRAALAPAEPSSTDLAVAAQATAERNRALAASSDGGESAPGDPPGMGADAASAAYRQVARQSRPDTIGLRTEA